MATPKVSREEAVNRIADAFRRYGYDGASLRILSDATGLGRASLYHHFPGGKDEMARAAFKAIGERLEADVLAPLRGKEPPRERLQRWIRGIDAFYDGGCRNCILGAMVLSGGSDRFSEELAGGFRLLITSLARVLRDAGVPHGLARHRAESAIGQIQGALVVSRGLGDRAPFQRALRELPAMMLAEA